MSSAARLDGRQIPSLLHSEEGEEKLLPTCVHGHVAKSTATIREAAIKETFYSGCAEEDIALARLLLVPEALAPLATPIRITEGNFGRVPRVYIECLRDKALPPALQKKMYTTLPCQQVISMDTDHSPFFSAPEELVTHWLSLES
jgi:hypothetical protein